MARRIAVSLDLHADPYIREAAVVTATTKAMDHEIHQLGDGTTHLGTEARKTAAEFEGLDERIRHARLEVGNLSLQFARTGDLVDQRNLRDAKRMLNTLERTRRDILAFATSDTIQRAGILAATSISTDVSGAITSALKGAFSTPVLGPILIAAAGLLASVWVPAIGAAVAGAVVGAAGLGGVVGGVIAAIKDPRVGSAFEQLKTELSQTLFGSSSSVAFVQPIIDSLHILARGFAELHLTDIFAKAATYLTILAQGIVNLFKNALPGFNEVMEQSGPIIRETARGLGVIGQAFGDLLHEVINSKGALLGLRVIFDVIAGAMVALGKVIGALGNAFKWLIDRSIGLAEAVAKLHIPVISGDAQNAADSMKKWEEGLGTWGGEADKADASAEDLAHSTEKVQQSMDTAAAAAARERAALVAMTNAMDVATQQSLDLWQAQLDAKSALTNVTQALKENGRNWDINTEKGRANQQSIHDAIAALIRQRDAEIQNSDGTTRAINQIKTKYDEQIRKLKDVARQMGATKAQADALAGTYNVTINVRIPGLPGIWDIEDWLRKHPQGHAAGGFAMAGVPTWVGEKGPEVITPLVPSWVTPHAQSMAWPGGVRGGDGAAAPVVYNVNVAVAPGANLDEFARVTVQALQLYEKRNGRRWRTP